MNQQSSKWRTTGISNNFMFRLVMERPELCKRLIEIVLDIKIKTLTYLEPEKNLEAKLASKGVRLDIYAEDEAGNIFDIEMQVGDRNKGQLGKRARYYQSMLDTDSLKKGELYSRLRKSVIIFICPFDPFDKGLGRYTFSHICHEDTSVSLDDEAEVVFINVLGDKHRVTRELANLMEYITSGKPVDDYTAALDQTVKKLQNDDGSEALFMTWEQTILEEREYARAEGEAKGRAEGKAEGKAEGRAEALKNLVKKGLISISVAAQEAGLTEEAFKKIACL